MNDRPTLSDRLRLYGPIAALAGFYTAFTINAARRIGMGMGDFRHFYYAAQAMYHHQDIYTSWKQGYLYPPLLAFLYLPIAPLSDAWAGGIILAVNILLAALVTILSAKEVLKRFSMDTDTTAVAIVSFFATLFLADKVKGEIQMWQTNILMLLGFTLGLRWLDKRPELAGLALGFAFNIKFLPIGFLPYLLIRRRFRAALGFVLGIALFNLLPALWVGWNQEIAYLKTVYSAVLDLVGVDTGLGVSSLNDISVKLSVSIPSGLARMLDTGASVKLPMAISAAIALACAAIVIVAYRRTGAPVFIWPKATDQQDPRFSALTAIEWCGLLTAALIFSPQTNTRHFFMLLLPIAAASALMIKPGEPLWRRLTLLAGIVVMNLGLLLPPGGPKFKDAVEDWQRVAGPSWCILAFCLCFVIAAVPACGFKKPGWHAHRSG